MFNQEKLQDVLEQYKQDFHPYLWEESYNGKTYDGERFKWVAVKTFRREWKPDAPDFADMLARALAGTGHILAAAGDFPRAMITTFAKADPEKVRAMFRNLYDEGQDVVERISAFKADAQPLQDAYGKKGQNHYQHEKAITTYLWLRYPDRYYIYRYTEAKAMSDLLESDYPIKKGAYASNIRNYLKLYDEVCAAISQDTEVTSLLRSHLADDCYPDPAYRTLTFDVSFYISHHYANGITARSRYQEVISPDPAPDPAPTVKNKQAGESDPPAVPDRRYWWLSASPKIWSFSQIAVGEKQAYTLYNDNGNKRRIFQNFLDAKVGDPVIGYESAPVKQVVALGRITAEQDGQEIEFEKTESLTSPIDYAALKGFPELAQTEFFTNPNGSLFCLTEDEYDFILDVIREENPHPTVEKADPYGREDFLREVFLSEQDYDRLVGVLKNKKNLILQGAPGVGKTFAARRLAWSVMGERDDDRIEFVQFHQNYSYEDFMLGYKPAGDGFELKTGVFYRFCQKAENQPDRDFFFIIDEINRGNMSRIFGELLMLIESDYRGAKTTLAYNGLSFSVPKNLYLIGMMNTADRSLAMIDYALRRRFSFFDLGPGFDSDGFDRYRRGLADETLDRLIETVKSLNEEIAADKSLGKGFCIGHSYFSNWEACTEEKMRAVVDYDIIPMLAEYWFDDDEKLRRWSNRLHEVFQ